MADVTQRFRDRWLSGLHMGEATPTQVVRIRHGEFRRAYKVWEGEPVRAQMPGPGLYKPWQATWTPLDDWRELPNVFEVDLDQDFDKNGVTSCTVQIDNIGYEERDGGAGVFHEIVRGFLSPLRGYKSPWRPAEALALNEWYRYLNGAVQLEISQGYGDELVQTFTGLIDEIDLTSAPDQVTITARDFGVALTDQHLFQKVKDPSMEVKPTIFADRKDSEKITHEGTAGPHDCTSQLAGHSPRYVADFDESTTWLTSNRDSPDDTEWVQIHLPKGFYQSFYLWPAYEGMEVWVSVYLRGHSKVDGVHHPEGWLDDHPGELVPGEEDGGFPYVRHFKTHNGKGTWHSLHHTLAVGDNTVVRVAFRKLRKVRVGGQDKYRAGVRRLFVSKQVRLPDPKQGKWILVDDISEIVKVALRWAGFKEWDVESTGTSLPKDFQLTFHNGDTLMDIIKKCQEITGYTFFIGEPSGGEDEYSIGVPIFRTANVLGMYDLGREEIRDDQLLTGIQVKQDLTVLSHIYWIRGKVTDPPKNHKKPVRGASGQLLGEAGDYRIQIYYVPPWSRDNEEGDIIRHFVAKYDSLGSKKGLETAARLAALQAALQSLTAVIEIPGHPGITVDSIVGVRDQGTGLNTRLYVASRSSTFRAGQSTEWKMTLGGSLIDSPNVQAVALDLYAVLTAKEAKGAKPHLGTAVAIDTSVPASVIAQFGDHVGSTRGGKRTPRRNRGRRRRGR
jgi:hypothetical protein